MEIINHPACTGTLAAPPGVEGVAPLPVAPLATDLGTALFSFWKPDAAELAALNAGQCVALGVYTQAENHPVVTVAVTLQTQEAA
jgi:hypothetical protein